jgi:hypothetical protein
MPPTPDDLKAKIDALIAKRDLAQLWGVYYARQVGGEAGEELLTEVMDLGDQAVRTLRDRAPQEVREALRRSTKPLNRDLIADLSSLIRQAEGRADRIQDVVSSVRNLWPFYSDSERQWFAEHWPDVRPDGPDAAEVPLPDVEPPA